MPSLADNVQKIDCDEYGHTQGPLDGSLYATILKSPKSPTASTHLISPPAEFSNGKPLLLVNGTAGTPGPPPVPERSKTPNSIYLAHNGTPRTTPVPFTVAPATPLPVGVAAANGDSKGAVRGSANSSYCSTTDAGSPVGAAGRTRTAAQQVDGRESVRSPLTVSMDSGISSSGPVNRRAQGSSVSPSSFPSQASPQGRYSQHRPLLPHPPAALSFSPKIHISTTGAAGSLRDASESESWSAP
uniref:Uncharacterized protein n=1 Tax=Anopheles farauti TaxID=69004 RepID=A0A182QUQ1_9DIPT